jgi:hypothetical protein
MKREHLINDTYQVIGKDGSTLFQGTKDECGEYMINKWMDNFNKLIEDFKI